MSPVYIIDARRTPIGRFGGGLKDLSAADLGFIVADAIMPWELREKLDQVIVGQVLQAGSGMNVARQILLKLGQTEHVPAYTVNMACGSSLKAVALAADSIRSGENDLVLAGGVESMSRAPHYATDLRFGKKLGDSSLQDAMFVDGLTDPLLKIGMGETAERIADKHDISRQEQDLFSVLSQIHAAASRAAFKREIIPAGDLTEDEHPRADTTVESLAKLKPAFRKDGTVTAGNASGINDGAAFALLASADAVSRHGLTPRARIIASAAVGCDPALMGLGPVGAIRKLCTLTGWALNEVDAIEINEAFAVQALGCVKELSLDTAKLNPRGGAIALGHPIGASGTRVLVTLLHHMEDNHLRRGIASLCIGGGMGIALAIEREK